MYEKSKKKLLRVCRTFILFICMHAVIRDQKDLVQCIGCSYREEFEKFLRCKDVRVMMYDCSHVFLEKRIIAANTTRRYVVPKTCNGNTFLVHKFRTGNIGLRI